MSYEPSDEAVEVVAKAIHDDDMSEALVPWGRDAEDVKSIYRGIARRALVALMGATVTEPCATCGGDGYQLVESSLPTADVPVPCPDCPAPRSLAVRECEKADVALDALLAHPVELLALLAEPKVCENCDGAGAYRNEGKHHQPMLRWYSRVCEVCHGSGSVAVDVLDLLGYEQVGYRWEPDYGPKGSIIHPEGEQ